MKKTRLLLNSKIVQIVAIKQYSKHQIVHSVSFANPIVTQALAANPHVKRLSVFQGFLPFPKIHKNK